MEVYRLTATSFCRPPCRSRAIHLGYGGAVAVGEGFQCRCPTIAYHRCSIAFCASPLLSEDSTLRKQVLGNYLLSADKIKYSTIKECNFSLAYFRLAWTIYCARAAAASNAVRSFLFATSIKNQTHSLVPQELPLKRFPISWKTGEFIPKATGRSRVPFVLVCKFHGGPSVSALTGADCRLRVLCCLGGVITFGK